MTGSCNIGTYYSISPIKLDVDCISNITAQFPLNFISLINYGTLNFSGKMETTSLGQFENRGILNIMGGNINGTSYALNYGDMNVLSGIFF